MHSPAPKCAGPAGDMESMNVEQNENENRNKKKRKITEHLPKDLGPRMHCVVWCFPVMNDKRAIITGCMG